MSKRYYYSDFMGHCGWYSTPKDFRDAFGLPQNARALRVAHVGVAAPVGYRKTGRELANDPVERVPTLRDLVVLVTQ